MKLLEMGVAQAKAWYAAQSLGADSEAERKRAMQTLRELGAASLPSLHAALRRTGAPRVQYNAAVVLHWLGDALGLSFLVDNLKWQMPSEPALVRDLEAAFILIGSPDATDALMRAWKQLLVMKENQRVRKSICRIWGALKDTRTLAVLAETALEHEKLFEDTVPKFGEDALDMLAHMLHDPLIAKRSLAVRTARHIFSTRVDSLLFPLLRDPHHSVRALVVSALEGLVSQQLTTPAAIYAETLNALEAGYSTPQSVAILIYYTQNRNILLPYDALLRLVLRWDSRQEPSGDTLEAVLAALPALANMPLYSTGARCELQAHFCAILSRRPEPALIVGIVRAIIVRGPETEVSNAHTRRTLIALMPHTDANVRREVASALQSLDRPVGKQLMLLLETAWPQPKLRDKVHALLRGNADATHVANQAMQWFTRFSKDTVDRWNANVSGRGNAPLPETDPRCPELLRVLLNNALDALEEVADSEQTAEMQNLAVACIRALVQLGVPVGQSAHSEIVRALMNAALPVKMTPYDARGNKEPRVGDGSDEVRLAAGQALLAMYGPDSFPLFVEAVHAPLPAARLTGIGFLGVLGDVRALPLLQSLAAGKEPLLAPAASAAIARIRQHNPETMTLLRASEQSDSRPETLLRPASGNNAATPPDVLLRPAQHPAQTSKPSAQSQP